MLRIQGPRSKVTLPTGEAERFIGYEEMRLKKRAIGLLVEVVGMVM